MTFTYMHNWQCTHSLLQCQEQALNEVYSIINHRHGQILEANQAYIMPTFVVKAYLPVSQSFGFTTELHSNTGGQAIPLCDFDHWDIISGDPFDATSKHGENEHACSGILLPLLKPLMKNILKKINTILPSK